MISVAGIVFGVVLFVVGSVFFEVLYGFLGVDIEQIRKDNETEG